jgi:hypothetical protein
MARVTAAHDMPTNMTTSATGPHLSSYRALGSRRAIRLARHTNIHSEYTMKTMATGARIAPHIPEATACRLDVAAAPDSPPVPPPTGPERGRRADPAAAAAVPDDGLGGPDQAAAAVERKQRERHEQDQDGHGEPLEQRALVREERLGLHLDRERVGDGRATWPP